MNKDILEGNWKQAKGKVKQMWGKLTDDEVERIDGNYDELVGIVQEKYGYNVQEAQGKVSEFLDSIKDKIKH